jgi:hypothetical protein
MVPRLETIPCGDCKGTGRCCICGGRLKFRKTWLGRKLENCGCTFVGEVPGKCSTCRGAKSVPWPEAPWLAKAEQGAQADRLLERLKSIHSRLGTIDPRLLSWESFLRVKSRKTFGFEDHDWMEHRNCEILAYREYLLFEEIRSDFYAKFRDELVEAGEHVHLEDIVRDAASGKLPVEFLTAVESKLHDLQGTGELKSVMLFRPEDLKVNGNPLMPVVPEQGDPELVAVIVDKSTRRRTLVRAPARGFDR